MKFNSVHLQSCFDASKPILDNINEIKNRVSEDIKNLETYLKSININEPIDYKIADPELSHNSNCEQCVAGTSCDHMIATEEHLLWDDTKKRLIYLYLEYQTNYNGWSNLIDWSSRKTLIEKPLIEMPFEKRKILYESKCLGGFLSFIAGKFAMKCDVEESEAFDDNIPF